MEKPSGTVRKTPDAVIIASLSRIVGGDAHCALMLFHLIAYPHHTYNVDGSISKTYEQWHAELGFDRHLIHRKVRRLMALGFVSMRIKRLGSTPTMHFTVDTRGLRDRIINDLQAHPNNTIGAQHGEQGTL